MNHTAEHTEHTIDSIVAHRASEWKLRTRTLTFSKRPLLMGILNVTPDSFSDGGNFHETADAIDRALQLIDEGADILDIGGESTRPYADPIDAATELARVEPVLKSLQNRCDVPISIDTSKASVARMALDYGAEIINDVTGLQGENEMVALAAESAAGVCAMHMQGTPQTMQDDPHYSDVVVEVAEYLSARLVQLTDAGIDKRSICLDPGIGFGKTQEHNLSLLNHCERFHDLGCPVLVGHSRKGFIAKLVGSKERDRTAGTIGIALVLARKGVQVLRVHDVQQVRDALITFDASGGMEPPTPTD